MRPSEDSTRSGLRPGKLVKQPHLQVLSAATETDRWESNTADHGRQEIHDDSVFEFVNPNGFGYVKSRSQVAGFQSHQFGESPRARRGVTLATVELVGLLLHPRPVVYVSPHLPNMDELRGAPTRPLDQFESAGLEAIKAGEDLFVGETPRGVRMLGAIRSAKQCLQCHEGNRGDLLGAFSYRLEGNSK